MSMNLWIRELCSNWFWIVVILKSNSFQSVFEINIVRWNVAVHGCSFLYYNYYNNVYTYFFLLAHLHGRHGGFWKKDKFTSVAWLPLTILMVCLSEFNSPDRPSINESLQNSYIYMYIYIHKCIHCDKENKFKNIFILITSFNCRL